jgi:dTDP-4-dehydrorhamnose 3,5-epimerase
MHFTPAPLKGAWLIGLEKLSDERGFFARLFCSGEFAAHGLESQFVQINDSFSREKGTLRGLHYQLPPAAETKVVRCVRGAVFDVIVDIRPASPTFKAWFGTILSEENRQMLYVPKGFAHGFLSLDHETELIYLVSTPYSKELERGIRWDDPAFNIRWPEAPALISDKDRRHDDFQINHSLSQL